METKIEFNDLPDWARQAVNQHLPHSRPDCYVSYTETLNLGPVWHDACRRIVVARNGRGQTMAAKSCYYDGILNASAREVAMHQGGETAIPPDGAVLVMETYPKSASLYLHPANAPKTLNAPAMELTDIQVGILKVLGGCTSAGRKDTWQRYHVPQKLVELVTRELAELGLVTISKAGAVTVTTKGHNIRNSTTRGIDFYKWYEECYDWKTFRLTGWAAEICRGYAKK